MTKPKAPSQLVKVIPPSIPRNAVQRAEARSRGLITGFLSNRKRGAPPKLHPNPKVPRMTGEVATNVIAPTIAIDTPVTVISVTDESTSKKASTASRGTYKNWSIEPMKSALDRAAHASLKGLDPQEAAGEIIIPGGTLRRRIKQIKAAAVEMRGSEYLYLKDFERGHKNDTRSLTSKVDREYIQHLIVLRDMRNNGMTLPEVFGLIQKLTNCSHSQAKQHWYYCRRKKLLPELKNHGALRTAQATTTKRSGVTTEKLLRWHGTVESALNEMDRLNRWHADWDDIKSSGKIDSFWGNMDETNMSAAEGAKKVVASKYVKKQQINTSDNKGTITVARCGLASGIDGPRFFLVKGEKIELSTFKGNFAAKHDAPPGSKVIATPNAYMTDNVWNEMSTSFAAGVRKLPIICDYPELWMVMTLDGFGSHLQPEALKVFSDHKILAVKEEGDTSHICQPYDKDVAKEDKRHHRSFLHLIRLEINMVDQWSLVLLVNKALNKIKQDVWQDSHHQVNLRPSTRVPFAEYIVKVKDVADAADFFYHPRHGMFDAMPACWKNLAEAQRREVAAIIGSFYDESRADPEKHPWSVGNLKKFLNLGYVNLIDMPKFRAAYLATRGDESIFIDPPPHDTTAHSVTSNNTSVIDNHDGFALKPAKLITKYQAQPGDSKTQGELFRHMTNFVCHKHAVEKKKARRIEKDINLEPTGGLNVEMTYLQRKMLNPTVDEVLLSDVIEQAQGERAKKKEARRKQDFINGNINSYSRILNNAESMEMVQDYNALAASMAMMNAEKDEIKAKSAAKRVEEAAESTRKKAELEAKENTKVAELLPGFQQELEEMDADKILGLPDKRKREYIRYFFRIKVVNLIKLKKEDLIKILRPHVWKHYGIVEEEELVLEHGTEGEGIIVVPVTTNDVAGV